MTTNFLSQFQKRSFQATDNQKSRGDNKSILFRLTFDQSAIMAVVDVKGETVLPDYKQYQGETFNVLAQSNLGWMYQRGKGVRQDYDSARYWYTMAALQDHAAAQNNLGTMFRDGLGMQADSDSARYWFEQAARHGLPQALNNLGRSAGQ